MYVAINHIHLPGEISEAGSALEGRFQNRARTVDGMPGFESFELLRPLPATASPHGQAGPAVYLVMTHWRDTVSFESWRTNDSAKAHSAPSDGPKHLAAQAWLTTHEPFESTYVPDWQHKVDRAISPVALMNVICVAAEHEGLFEEAFRTREGGVEEQPGFLSLEVLRPLDGAWDGPAGAFPRPGLSYVVFTRWASYEAHQDWTRSEAFRRAHGRRRLPEGAVLQSGVERFAVLQPALA